MAATPGCLAVDCWVSDDGQAVMTTGEWDTQQALAGRLAYGGTGTGARWEADLRRAAGQTGSGSFRCAADEGQGFLGQGRPVLARCRV